MQGFDLAVGKAPDHGPIITGRQVDTEKPQPPMRRGRGQCARTDWGLGWGHRPARVDNGSKRRKFAVAQKNAPAGARAIGGTRGHTRLTRSEQTSARLRSFQARAENFRAGREFQHPVSRGPRAVATFPRFQYAESRVKRQSCPARVPTLKTFDGDPDRQRV
jgi:hypothetical protein